MVAQVSGTVISFDPNETILIVNTQLGRKSFLVPNSALVLLNNHTTTQANIRVGDEVLVTYEVPTPIVRRIEITRETRRQGTIIAASGGSISLRTNSGTVFALSANTASVIELNGIPITNNAVLVGRHAAVIFEPETFLILSLDAQAQELKGRISVVDQTNRTITVTNGRTVFFTVDLQATIRRNGASDVFTNLLVGDRVTVAFVRAGQGGHRALAIQARGVTTIFAPTTLTAAALSATAVRLTWQDNDPDEGGFAIERKLTSAADFVQVATVVANPGSGNIVTFDDTGLMPNTSYQYRVRAFKQNGENEVFSGYTNTVTVTTPA